MNTTNKTLLQIHQEIQQMQLSVIGLFLRSKIKNFYSDNGLRIDTLHGKMRKLQSEYFIVENGQIKKDGEGKDAQPVLREGKDRKDFEDKFEALMAEETNIKI